MTLLAYPSEERPGTNTRIYYVLDTITEQAWLVGVLPKKNGQTSDYKDQSLRLYFCRTGKFFRAPKAGPSNSYETLQRTSATRLTPKTAAKLCTDFMRTSTRIWVRALEKKSTLTFTSTGESSRESLKAIGWKNHDCIVVTFPEMTFQPNRTLKRTPYRPSSPMSFSTKSFLLSSLDHDKVGDWTTQKIVQLIRAHHIERTQKTRPSDRFKQKTPSSAPHPNVKMEYPEEMLPTTDKTQRFGLFQTEGDTKRKAGMLLDQGTEIIFPEEQQFEPSRQQPFEPSREQPFELSEQQKLELDNLTPDDIMPDDLFLSLIDKAFPDPDKLLPPPAKKAKTTDPAFTSPVVKM